MEKTNRIFYRVSKCFALFLIPALLGNIPAVQATIIEQSGDLMDAIETVRINMPGRDDEGFVPPSSSDLDLWRFLSQALLDDDPAVVDSIISADFSFYELVHFIDAVDVAGSGISSPPNNQLVAFSEAHPNPFGQQTRFSLLCRQSQLITVEVIDVAGRRIAILHEGHVRADEKLELSFEAGDLPSGVYFVRAIARGVIAARKIVLLR